MPTDDIVARRTFTVPPVDLLRTLRAIRRSGRDPTTRLAGDGFWRATHTPEGPATLHVVVDPATTVTEEIVAEAWGPGAAAVLDRVPGLVGADDHPEDLVAHHEIVAEALRRRPGRRLPATKALVEVLLPTVIEQKVTGLEAWEAFRALVWYFGEAAPGPTAAVRLPPPAERLAELGYAALHPLGLERRRAEVLLRVARRAPRIDALVSRTPAQARAALEELPGLGPWTSTSATLLAFGDPDAVVVGDFHLPHLVVNALTGRRRGSDAEMLELLAPYVGQRARAQQLLAGLADLPRRAPRRAPRRFADH